MKILLAVLLLALLLLPTIPAALAWEMERPNDCVKMYHRAENCSTDGMVSAGLGMSIDYYDEDHPPTGKDQLWLNVSMTANARTGITYGVEYDAPYVWWDAPWPTNIVGDDEGAWIDIPLDYVLRSRFYGGPSSAEYDRIWVCTNGFVSFQDNYTTRYPTYFPNPAKPNAVIAAFWTDLLVDDQASITYGRVGEYPNFGLAISWNNVLNKGNSQRQTFQIFIRDFINYRQSVIYINYKSVVASSTPYSYGIEDQEGMKGVGSTTMGDQTRRSFRFFQNSNYALLRCLTIDFDENDDSAKILILQNSEYVRGYNLRYSSPEPADDPTVMFLLALSGPAVLLLGSTLGGVIALVEVACQVARYVLIAYDAVELVHKFAMLFKEDVEVLDARDSYGSFGNPPINQGAYAKVLTADNVVDASFGICVLWVFTDDDRSQDHSLKVSATVQYDEYDSLNNFLGSNEVTTSTNLNIIHDAGNTINNARCVTTGEYLAYVDDPLDSNDYYYCDVTVPANKYIYVTMTPLRECADFDLYLYNAGGQLLSWSIKPGNLTEEIWYVSSIPRNYYVRVNAVVCRGLYTLKIGITDTPPNPPGGGCPTLFVWNGMEYAYEVLLNIHADSDVTLGHAIEQPLVRDGFFYKLSLRELDEFTSRIDQVKLYAVNSDGEKHRCLLASAVHNQQGRITASLWSDDEIRVNIHPTETIELKFTPPYPIRHITYFIFEINGYNPKENY
jgi:hypothetical protein